MKLVKHSVYLSPSDFLLFPFYDIVNLLAVGSYQGTTPGVIGKLFDPVDNTDLLANNNDHYNIHWVRELIIFVRAISMCYSSQLINPAYNALQNLSSSLANIRLTSFNPPHSVVTGGPYFMLYVNIYQFFKFCGLKVKFIPHTTKAATTVPEYNGIIAQAGENQSVQIGYEPSGRCNSCFALGKMDNNLADHINDDDDVKTVAPPQYRLWVNFDKFGPLSNYLPPWALAGDITQLNTYVEAGNVALNPNIWDKRCLQTRMKFLNVFKDTQNTAQLKSFSMTRPFKFYVRPYEVEYTSENPIAPAADENMDRNDALKYIVMSHGDQNQKKPKRQRWIRTPALYPPSSVAFANGTFYRGNAWDIGTPGVQANKSAQEMIQNNRLVASNFCDDNFYNPPLFNYFVTRDDLDSQEGQNLLGVYQSNHNDGATYFRRYSYEGYPNFNNAGKFKLTFYYRFKRPKPEVSMNLPVTQTRDANRQDSDASILSTTDAIGVKAHITANDLPVNLGGVFSLGN